MSPPHTHIRSGGEGRDEGRCGDGEAGDWTGRGWMEGQRAEVGMGPAFPTSGPHLSPLGGRNGPPLEPEPPGPRPTGPARPPDPPRLGLARGAGAGAPLRILFAHPLGRGPGARARDAARHPSPGPGWAGAGRWAGQSRWAGVLEVRISFHICFPGAAPPPPGLAPGPGPPAQGIFNRPTSGSGKSGVSSVQLLPPAWGEWGISYPPLGHWAEGRGVRSNRGLPGPHVHVSRPPMLSSFYWFLISLVPFPLVG